MIIGMITEDINKKREDILRIAQRHGVLSIRLFGSCARGDVRRDSDVDFLITVGSDHSRWFPGGLVADLEELIGRPVDVVEEEVLSADVRSNIIQESVPL
jgi:hypothetical protein